MARTIGRKYKNEIVRLVGVAKACKVPNTAIADTVRHYLDAKAWDTWEMADSEINRLIDDEIFKAEVA